MRVWSSPSPLRAPLQTPPAPPLLSFTIIWYYFILYELRYYIIRYYILICCRHCIFITVVPAHAFPVLRKRLPQVPRGASKSKPLRYEVSQRELEEMIREQGWVCLRSRQSCNVRPTPLCGCPPSTSTPPSYPIQYLVYNTSADIVLIVVITKVYYITS